jgi:hypothetical protein
MMDDYPIGSAIRRRYELLKPVLDERRRRLWAAAEALILGTGGIPLVSGVTGLSRTTIRAGIKELRSPDVRLADPSREGRVRRPGAGRRSIVQSDETLEADLETLLESSQEEIVRPLAWTCKSLRTLANELAIKGHQVSYRTLGNLFHRTGYAFSSSASYKQYSVENRRDQYRLISRRSSWFLEQGAPVVSLRLSERGVGNDRGNVIQPVRPNRRTAELGVSILQHWWRHSGSRKYPRARRLLVTTDTSGLPIGDRAIWGPLLQPLAEESGLEIVAAHFPPGVRRWRRSVHEVTNSFSRPGTHEASDALTVDLDLILLFESEIPRRTAARQGPGESGDDFWNYRIEARSRGSAG